MLTAAEGGAAALREVLQKTNYLFVCKILRGTGDFVDPWFDFDSMRRAIEQLASPYRNTFLLLMLGLPGPKTAIADEIGMASAQALIACGLWEEKDDMICCRDDLIVLCYRGLWLVTELNPWFGTCRKKNTDVYIGSDSLRLAENISFRKGARVLDLCSGTGIQGLMAARSAAHVVSVEINPVTVPVTRFNVLLNGMQDVVEVREGDLYSALSENERFDCIYANPPFIPMTDSVNYPICGTGGEDGLRILRSILSGLPQHLLPGGEITIFCECLGDEKVVFFDREVKALAMEHGWKCLAAHIGRSEAGDQIERLAKLTALFQDPFDPREFKRSMHGIYDRLHATYLYDILYHLEDAGDPAFLCLDTYNPWHYQDHASVSDALTARKLAGEEILFLDGKPVGRVKTDAAELLNCFRSGDSVEEAAKWVFFKYRNTLIGKRTSYYAYLTQVLTTCRLLENLGVLCRLPSNA